MSHMVETMAYAGEVPWHGLGKRVHNDLTPDQMLVEAGLDWEVVEVPSFVEFNGDKIPTGKKALVRSTDGRVLTNTGENWHPLQNSEAFEFFQEFVMAGNMEMHTAGSLDDGRMVWALAKVKDSFTIGKKDTVESYLLLTNPHRYGKSIEARFTPIRVVCNNTLTYALSQQSEQMARVGHRTKFDADLVKETLGIAGEMMQDYKELAEVLSSKRYKKDTVEEYFGKIFPLTSNKRGNDLSRNAQMALDVLETQPGGDLNPGTWWQAANAVTYLTDHHLGNSQETRLQSAWFGGNRNKKVKALELAHEYAMAA